jgi:predicted lysophospholipase L1 biosynthesis ABC-type transport system permease subunit
VTNVLGKITMAIRFLALISLGLGIPVLFSAVAATRRERLREGDTWNSSYGNNLRCSVYNNAHIS